MPGHKENQPLPAQFRGLVHPDLPTVPEHRNPPGNLENLVELMAHEKRRHPPGFQQADYLEEAIHLRPGKRRGRLIENQQLRLAHDAPGNLHLLLLSD